MKWTVEPAPQIGDQREIRRFAFIPELLEGNIKVWLEYYYVHQIYVRGRGDDFWSDQSSYSESRPLPPLQDTPQQKPRDMMKGVWR